VALRGAHGVGQQLVGLAQQVADIAFQRFPEAVRATFSMRVLELLPALPPACRPAMTTARTGHGSGTGRGDLRVDRHRAGHVARHVDVIDPVAAQKGRVGLHDEVGAIQFEAHIDLTGDAGQQLRQGLVDRVERDRAFDARVNVDIDPRIARQCEQQFATGTRFTTTL
jgi:hypothetical protein